MTTKADPYHYVCARCGVAHQKLWRSYNTSYEVQWGSNWCSDFDVLQAGKSVEDLPSDLLHYSDAGDVQGVIENANSPAMAVAVLLRQLTR